MCSLGWNSTVPREYRKWVLGSDSNIAGWHRFAHRTLIINLGVSVLYQKTEFVQLRAIGIDARISPDLADIKDPDHYEKVSDIYIGRLLKQGWTHLSGITGEQYEGNLIEFSDEVIRIGDRVRRGEVALAS